MRDALDIRVRSLQKKGEGSYSSKSNSIRQSVSKEGNWPCIRLKYYPTRGRWKNREKSLPKRGRINLEAATRRIHTLIDETNPRNFRLCYSHVKDRSWFVPFIRGTTILFLLPFPPPFPSFCFDARTLIGAGRSAIQTEQIIRVSLVRMSGADEWRESVQSIQIEKSRENGGKKFDSLVIRCQAERISMTINGFPTFFFKSYFNETIVKRI